MYATIAVSPQHRPISAHRSVYFRARGPDMPACTSVVHEIAPMRTLRPNLSLVALISCRTLQRQESSLADWIRQQGSSRESDKGWRKLRMASRALVYIIVYTRDAINEIRYNKWKSQPQASLYIIILIICIIND